MDKKADEGDDDDHQKGKAVQVKPERRRRARLALNQKKSVFVIARRVAGRRDKPRPQRKCDGHGKADRQTANHGRAASGQPTAEKIRARKPASGKAGISHKRSATLSPHVAGPSISTEVRL